MQVLICLNYKCNDLKTNRFNHVLLILQTLNQNDTKQYILI